ncbi:MAG: glycosyltransferase [Desulfuromonadales bacterium]|nr:glycosyltransferase [Desulfuromonadales bacterium]
MPRVSILLPVRDEERLLPAALKSLARQTMQDWELIAVDDGSSDGTATILARAARKDARIRVLQRPPAGLVAALNHGLAVCRAELVARMDADDICDPRRLELQVAQLEHEPTTTLLACRVRHFPRSAIRGGFLAYEAWQNSLLTHAEIVRDFYVESPFAHPSVVFRRRAVEAVGGYRDMGWAEDYDLWLRLKLAGARFARRPETLLYWRDRADRLSRTGDHCTLAAFRACKVHFLCRDYLAGTDRVTLWGAGKEGKAWRLALAGQGIAVERWIEIDRNKIGQTIHGAPVVDLQQLTAGQGKILITVGAKGARQQIREFAAARGLHEGDDFLCVT